MHLPLKNIPKISLHFDTAVNRLLNPQKYLAKYEYYHM
jgi:hypothetical protein